MRPARLLAALLPLAALAAPPQPARALPPGSPFERAYPLPFNVVTTGGLFAQTTYTYANSGFIQPGASNYYTFAVLAPGSVVYAVGPQHLYGGFSGASSLYDAGLNPLTPTLYDVYTLASGQYFIRVGFGGPQETGLYQIGVNAVSPVVLASALPAAAVPEASPVWGLLAGLPLALGAARRRRRLFCFGPPRLRAHGAGR